MSKSLVFVFTCCFVVACNSLDRGNPEAVIKANIEAMTEKKYQQQYDLLSKETRSRISVDEYVKQRKSADTSGFQIISSEEPVQITIDDRSGKFKKYEVMVKWRTKDDSSRTKFTYSLTREGHDWAVIWTGDISDRVDEFISRRQFVSAIKLLREAVVHDPYEERHYLDIARCFYYGDEFAKNDSAKAYLTRALQCNDNDVSSNELYSLCLTAEGKYDLAVAKLLKTIKSTESRVEKANLYLNVVWAQLFKGDLEMAEYYLGKAKDQTEPNYYWYRTSGIIEFRRGNYPKAEIMQAKSLEMSGEKGGRKYIVLEYVDTLLKLNKRILAKQVLLDELEENPDDIDLKQKYTVLG